MLTELGIDGLQGFYFSPPLPFDALCHVAARVVARPRCTYAAARSMAGPEPGHRHSHTVCRIASRFISGVSSARQSAVRGSTASCARSV